MTAISLDSRQRFEEALDSLVEKLRQDSYVIAAILLGSLAYDEVWEKSDIDLYVIVRDDTKAVQGHSLVENGINISTVVYPRRKFKEMYERSLQSSFFHSAFSKSRLLFSTDATIEEYYQNLQHIGSRDREMQLLSAASHVFPVLAKAEKWYTVKRDMEYAFVYILGTVDSLAKVEVILNGEVTTREVIHQALRHNPTFFRAIYTDLIHGPKDERTLGEALRLINDYLDEKGDLLFKPILEFLEEAGGPRSMTDLDEHFKKKAPSAALSFACEWLADKGTIEKVSSPVVLTEKSRIRVDEAAYYYDGR